MTLSENNDIIGSHADFDVHYRAPRSQREAGIDWMSWESRAEPIRPWGRDVMAVLFLAAFLLVCIGIDWRFM